MRVAPITEPIISQSVVRIYFVKTVSNKCLHRFSDWPRPENIIDTTGTVTFITGENIETSGTNELVFAKSVEDEYLAAHHYESGGEYVDILNDSGVPSLSLTRLEKTVLDELHRQNDDLKQIKVIKNQFINQIVSSFKEALRSWVTHVYHRLFMKKYCLNPKGFKYLLI